ncbi:MAG: DUF971 domain-containing protein [Planctomycetales bacterium]|nr:DUF971 domain-containing protein [Planctomycetales bacterium]
MLVPVRLARTARGLEIEWSDGVTHELRAAQLQKACPCATCRERAKGDSAGRLAGEFPTLPIVGAAGTSSLEIVRMEPVGNYAYSIQFSHGCGKGIYTFELLRSLGEAAGKG